MYAVLSSLLERGEQIVSREERIRGEETGTKRLYAADERKRERESGFLLCDTSSAGRYVYIYVHFCDARLKEEFFS